MKHFYKILVLACLTLFTAACSDEQISERLIPQEESEFAKEYLSKLRTQDYDYIRSLLSPDLQSQVDNEVLAQIASYFRPGDAISTNIVGSQVHTTNSQWYGNFTFEYEFESGWNLANVEMLKVDDGYQVIGLNVYQTEAAQGAINEFTLVSKSPLQYLVFALAIVIPIFILITLVVCIRTPMPKRKWLWAIFILFGFGSVQVNWTTGAVSLQLLSFHLFGASAYAFGPAAPWVISVAFPLGAVIFWFKRKKFIQHSAEAAQPLQSGAGATSD